MSRLQTELKKTRKNAASTCPTPPPNCWLSASERGCPNDKLAYAADAMSTKKLHELTSSLQAALTTEKVYTHARVLSWQPLFVGVLLSHSECLRFVQEQRMEMEHEYGAMAAERDALLAERNHLRDMVEQMQVSTSKQ